MENSSQNPPDNAAATPAEAAADFTTVESIFVRHRNCLMLKADFSPLYVDYYLHLMQHGLRHAELEDGLFKSLLGYFTLHLVSRPWAEYHAWTLNLREPLQANFFVSGSSLSADVVGRIFMENVKVPESNMLFAQNIVKDRDPQTSVIVLHGKSIEHWVEDFYQQSEQRMARCFYLGGDSYALITAQPGADHDWLTNLTAENVAAIGTESSQEETKLLETRRFNFNCGCTVEKVLPTLQAMKEDLADIISEQGYLDISCPRCEAHYKVTPQMLD